MSGKTSNLKITVVIPDELSSTITGLKTDCRTNPNFCDLVLGESERLKFNPMNKKNVLSVLLKVLQHG